MFLLNSVLNLLQSKAWVQCTFYAVCDVYLWLLITILMSPTVITFQTHTTMWCYFTHMMPFSSRMAKVEKLQCAPDPFQLPGMGLGSNVTITPYSSAMRCRIYRATQRSSAHLIPSPGPTWNSHWNVVTIANQFHSQLAFIPRDIISFCEDSPEQALLQRLCLQ
jgi:hypothetical protein